MPDCIVYLVTDCVVLIKVQLVLLLKAPDENEFSCLCCDSGLLLHFHHSDHSIDILEF